MRKSSRAYLPIGLLIVPILSFIGRFIEISDYVRGLFSGIALMFIVFGVYGRYGLNMIKNK